MIASLRNSFAVAALIALAACATGPRPTPYWTIHDTAFKDLKPGVSTEDDVRKQLGVPLTESHFPRKNEDVWEYRYMEGTTRVMLAYVHFDPQSGLLKYTEQYLDPAFHGGVGGASM
jgi:hypothetical protein